MASTFGHPADTKCKGYWDCNPRDCGNCCYCGINLRPDSYKEKYPVMKYADYVKISGEEYAQLMAILNAAKPIVFDYLKQEEVQQEDLHWLQKTVATYNMRPTTNV